MRPSNFVIAGFSIAIECTDESIASYLKRELEPFLGGQGNHMKLSLALDRVDTMLCEEGSEGQINVTLPNGIEMCLEQESGAGEVDLRVAAVLPPGEETPAHVYCYDFLINYIFSLVVQELQAGGKAHIFLIHSCGAVCDGRGFLFAGSSGKGKSTTATALADGGFRLLGDDMVLVSRDNDGWKAHGSPMGGDLSRTELVNDTVPLEAILLIEQAERTGLREASPAVAAAALIGLVVPSYPLTRVAPKQLSDYSQETAEILLEEAALLAADVPCFHLGISLDDRPWQQIFHDVSKREAEAR